MRARLIANPNATGVDAAVIDAVAGRLATVAEVDLRLTERAGHAADLAGEPGADAVIGLGGDGTANELVNGVAAGAVVGVVPAGASSVFARQLGLGRDPVAGALRLAEALRAGRAVPFGLGSVNGRLFTFSAGLGLEAESMRLVAERRSRRQSGRRPGDLAVVATAFRALRDDRFSIPETMTVTAAGAELRAGYVAVGNGNPYSYFRRLPVRTTPRAGPASALDLVAIGALRSRDLWRLPVYGLVWARHAGGGDRRVAYLHDVAEAQVDCDRPVALQLDGEYLGMVERAELRYHPGAVRVLIPPGAAWPAPAPASAAADT